MKKPVSTLVALAICAFIPVHALAHCEVPCGIYGDKMRLDTITEHITTIEKAMKQIAELSAAGDKNYNQIVRWVTTKESHATEIQHIVQQYFLTQRIKRVEKAQQADYEKYLDHLRMLHGMLVEAMKTKQSTDAEHIAHLRQLTKEFRASYLGPEGEAHTH